MKCPECGRVHPHTRERPFDCECGKVRWPAPWVKIPKSSGIKVKTSTGKVKSVDIKLP